MYDDFSCDNNGNKIQEQRRRRRSELVVHSKHALTPVMMAMLCLWPYIWLVSLVNGGVAMAGYAVALYSGIRFVLDSFACGIAELLVRRKYKTIRFAQFSIVGRPTKWVQVGTGRYCCHRTKNGRTTNANESRRRRCGRMKSMKRR